jgi:hypothetical protein
VEQRAGIERRIEALRTVKGTLPLDRYEDRLEALLVELALVHRGIRAERGDR